MVPNPYPLNSSLKILKNFASETISEQKITNKADLSWLVNTQKSLNGYLHDFQDKFDPKVRTAIEEQQLSEMQANVMINAQQKIPSNGKLVLTDFFPKLLQSFALHNRNLAEKWDP